jgi:tetratricopeptide (TPR) repeat protein
LIVARRPLVALAAVIALVALIAQLLGDGLYGSLAEPHTLPHHLAGDWPFAVLERTGLDRIAPIRIALARAAIVRNEPARAVAFLATLPESPDVDDLRGRAALAAGDMPAALRNFEAAGDFVTATAAIDALATADPRAALAVVRAFIVRLDARRSMPEIAAEAMFREGTIAAMAGERYPIEADAFYRESAAAFASALARAPNEEKYLLNDAFAALRIGKPAEAHGAYVRAAQVVPDSVDAFVGVAASSAVLGNCAGATAAFARARMLAPQQHRAADAAAAGYAPAVLAALARCGA